MKAWLAVPEELEAAMLATGARLEVAEGGSPEELLRAIEGRAIPAGGLRVLVLEGARMRQATEAECDRMR